MRSNTSLLGRVIFWIASEMLEILTKILRIIFNENLCAPCVPWIFGGLLRKKSLGEIFNKYGLRPEINHHRNLNGY